MKQILWLNPTGRDKRELRTSLRASRVRIIYHGYASDALKQVCAEHKRASQLTGCRMPLDETAHVCAILKDLHIDGIVTSLSYPSSCMVAALVETFNLPGTPTASNLVTQHKYYARRTLDAHVPEVNPPYQRLTYDTIDQCSLAPPYIIKPVTAAISMGTYTIHKQRDLDNVCTLPEAGYFAPLADLLAAYTSHQLDTPELIAEQQAHGWQVTVDGYIQHEEVTILGVVDAHFYPETLSFYKFDYPSRLSSQIQQRMYKLTKRCVLALGLNNTLFNAEFIYNREDDTITLIEINPRMSSQFSHMYRAVDGVSMYDIAIAIACNETVPAAASATYPHAASFAIRRTHDAYIAQTPTPEEKQRVYQRYPNVNIEVYCHPGTYLSQQPQDTYTYIYMIINVCASDAKEAERICTDIHTMLTFVME